MSHDLLRGEVEPDAGPAPGGVEVFDTIAATQLNQARLDHLATLGLPLERQRVLDAGGGPGHLAQFFVERDCSVVSIDARPGNIARLRTLYPSLDGRVLDVERDDLTPLGRFDVVFCYGLLYHLENPLLALRNMAAVCDGLLLIETQVCDSSAAVLLLVTERECSNQGLRGLAHRPSPTYVATVLERIGLRYVYRTTKPPRHPDFEVEWRDDLACSRDQHLLRYVFVASRAALALPTIARVM